MAERRMFAKTIVTSDAFLDMPASTRCLYFLLGMVADDDGFVNNPKSIMRQAGATIDDMNLLIAKRFILTFQSGVVVIKHWRIHNLIQKDRYKETKYLEEKKDLQIDSNGAYTEADGIPLDAEKVRKPLTDAQQKRLEAKKESSLPYSFEYKMRQAFHGEQCPICNCVMDGSNNLTKPTIQHNTPISLGGKHEIENISIICSGCNSSIQNRQETPPYNTDLVRMVWERIENVSIPDTQVRLGEDRLRQVSVGEVNDNVPDINVGHKSPKVVRHKYGAYKNVLLSDEDFLKLQEEFPRDYPDRIERLSEYMASTGKSYKNHLATIRNWAKRDKPKAQAKKGSSFLDLVEDDYE